MCRWIAYIGKPIYIDQLVTKPALSLVEQSLNSRMSFSPEGKLLATNGDGFGVGWFSGKPEPGLFKGAEPAWGNENLNEICSQTKAHLFMAHIRAASTGDVQRSNSHPFKYRNWLFQHNGYVNEFEKIRRDLQCEIAPHLYPYLRGTTDSETFFLLALTDGLEKDPKTAMELTIARIVRACRKNDVTPRLILSCAIGDGERLYTMRYAIGDRPHSQYYSTHAESMKEINEDSTFVPPQSVVVVSEPLDQSGEHWLEMPPGSFAVIENGTVRIESLSIRDDDNHPVQMH